MKQREMIEQPSRLTWDNILAVLREDTQQGYTNTELAELLGVTNYDRIAALTKTMYEAGALSRVHTGRRTGVSYYFLPL